MMLRKSVPAFAEVGRFDNPSDQAFALALSADGKRLACAGGQSVAVWDVPAGKQVAPAGHAGPIGSLAFSGDGRVLASAGIDDGIACAWDTGSGARRHCFTGGNASVALSRDGKTMATGSSDGGNSSRAPERYAQP